ncbi:uncharacterized protein FIBRA_02441 [Fibroporia radiculosa]|uniref:AAA+ ATPase domain-containing protein n=1 Tax=Fibroporia radiculosa TaxID=599839 RepID=J4I923_9APHY|nr:uncharacterized protein FIBRA_02441 [Fibroporia radiculosa]CCM00411.1 predicted protein [Fibroporia radiculosa]
MQQPRTTRSSVLGKRPHQSPSEPATPSTSECPSSPAQLPFTPDSTPNPKRLRVSPAVVDGDGNKENVPPFLVEILGTPTSIRSPRTLRRNSTETAINARLRTIRRYSSTSSLAVAPETPATAFNHLSLFTPPPTPPSVLLPLHVRVRALLRPTCNGGSGMAGREAELDIVRNFLHDFSQCDMDIESTWSALYISGSPGTGKTALVNTALDAFRSQANRDGIIIMSVNCMALTNLDAVWDRLAEGLQVDKRHSRKGKKSRQSSRQCVEALLVEHKTKCVIVLDELDHIASNSQSLASIFSLAQSHKSQLRLIGIANTHTLTSSSTAFTLESTKGVETLHFAPYASEQLLSILTDRLDPLTNDAACAGRMKKFIPLPSMTLLAKKIAAHTGDVRAAFEVLRNAIDLAVTSSKTPDMLDSPDPTITPSHILSAFKAFASVNTTPRPKNIDGTGSVYMSGTSDGGLVTKVRELGLHSRLGLLAMMLARQRIDMGLAISGSSVSSTVSPRSPIKRSHSAVPSSSRKTLDMDITQLHAFYSSILTRGDGSLFTPVSRSEFGDLLGVMETVGLVSLTSSSNSLPGTPSRRRTFRRTASVTNGSSSASGHEVRFVDGIRMEEITRGLGISHPDTPANIPNDVREEEVRAIWNRENARMAREAKATVTRQERDDTFSGALEN